MIFGLVFLFALFLLFISFVIGMVNPSIIFRKNKRNARLKIFGLWIGSNFAIFILAFALAPAFNDMDIEEVEEYNISEAEKLIDQGEHEKATELLDRVTEDSEQKEIADILKLKADSLEAVKRIEELKNTLTRELESIDKGIDFSDYRGDITNLQLELVLFNVWAKHIKNGKESGDKEIVTLAQNMERKVQRIQRKEFPILRKEYSKLAAKIMWEHDVNVFSDRGKSTRINYTSSMFTLNRNIKDFNTQVWDILGQFRFKQARYRWFKYDDEYSTFALETPDDGDIVSLD